MARIGTLEWADENEGGLLTTRDRFTLRFGQSVPALIAKSVGFLLDPLMSVRSAALPPIPDSDIANEAKLLCKQISEDWLEAHCYRTYAIGALLGRDLKFDRDLLFVASMLHDAGLTDAYKKGSEPPFGPKNGRKDAPCFAVRGAGVARSLATKHGCPQAFSDRLSEAISLHLNVRIPRSLAVEAHLLNAGSALDLIRLRYRKLGAKLIRSIEAEWPCLDVCGEVRKVWKREAGIHRDCRVACLNSWPLFFDRRLRKKCPSH
jgi:hypothetical protein